MDEIKVTLEDINRAIPLVGNVARQTPLLQFERQRDESVWLKLENLQLLGSFKIRGIWNCLSRMSRAELKRGLGIFSSGNAGLALAWTAKRLGVPCRAFVSEGADAWRVQAILAQGAEVERMPVAEIFRI